MGDNYLASFMGLSCAWFHIILAVISEMTNPKVIESKSGWRNGGETFTHSAKRRINILRRVTPRQPVRSNWSGYFCNTLQRIQDRCLRGWKFLWGGGFALSFIWEIENPPSNRRISKYIAGK